MTRFSDRSGDGEDTAHPGRVPESHAEGRHIADEFMPDAPDDIAQDVRDEFQARVFRHIRLAKERRAQQRSRDNDGRGRGREREYDPF